MALIDYKTDQGYCNRCSNCKWIPSYRAQKSETMYICPSVMKYNFNAYSGCGKLQIGYSINDGHTEVCATTRDVVYRCTLCGACDYACKVFRKDIDVAENIEELRKACVEAGFVHPEHKIIAESLRKNGNRMGKPAAECIDWTEGLKIKKTLEGGKGDIYFHGGDFSVCDKTFAGRTNRTAKLLLSKHIDIIVSGAGELSAADKAFDLGFIDEGRAAAVKLAADVKRSGARTLVTLDTHAFMAFRWHYPRYGVDLGVEVLHITQLLERLYANGLLSASKAADMTVTWHDPCNLGRRSEPYKGAYDGNKRRRPMALTRTGDLGEYRAPRTLLAAIPSLRLVEMDRIKGWALCCGNAAGMAEVNPELVADTADNRMAEARLTGADALVTVCPMCEAALGATGVMKVIDLVDLVLDHME
jgi:Fe-S oxidoreductase